MALLSADRLLPHFLPHLRTDRARNWVRANFGDRPAKQQELGDAHDFLRMPSCHINVSIEGLALGVATAIAQRTYESLTI